METVNLLSERAMLVHMRERMWTGRKKDKEVSQTVTTTYQAEADSGSWWTYLIPKRYISSIETACAKVRREHYKYTLPWMDGGLRILPSAAFTDYSAAIRKAQDEFDLAVESFLEEYPYIQAKAHQRLGQLGKNAQFPSVEELRGKFSIHYEIFPLPNSADFRVDLGADEVEHIKKGVEKSINTRIEKAMTDLWQRFSQLVEKMEDTLKDSDKNFRVSLIDNLKEFTQTAKKYNITNDPKLDEIVDEVREKLTNLNPDDMRYDLSKRREAATAAKSLLDKMSGYIQ